jgi:hypothetical protein
MILRRIVEKQHICLDKCFHGVRNKSWDPTAERVNTGNEINLHTRNKKYTKIYLFLVHCFMQEQQLGFHLLQCGDFMLNPVFQIRQQINFTVKSSGILSYFR